MSNVMNNPPVFHMLVQVQFNRLPLIKEHINRIQDEFRKFGFPDLSHNVQTHAQINISNADPAQNINFEQHHIDTWSFGDFDKKTGYMLTENSIVFHTTAYENFERTQPSIIKGLEIIHNILKIDYIERVGMRFLNAFSAEDNTVLSDYLQENVLGSKSDQLNHKGFQTQQSVTESIFNNGVNFCIIRVVTGTVANSPPLMPNDLLPLIGTLELKSQFKNMNGKIAILDIDCSEMERKKFDLQQLAQSTEVLHSNVKDLFESTIKKQKVQ